MTPRGDADRRRPGPITRIDRSYDIDGDDRGDGA